MKKQVPPTATSVVHPPHLLYTKGLPFSRLGLIHCKWRKEARNRSASLGGRMTLVQCEGCEDAEPGKLWMDGWNGGRKMRIIVPKDDEHVQSRKSAWKEYATRIKHKASSFTQQL